MAWTCDVSIEEKVRQDCYNRGYEQGRKNPCDEIVAYIEELQKQVKEYRDKIEQGTLIELPCKVGDTIYLIFEERWSVGKKETHWYIRKTKLTYGNMERVIKEYGEFVFLTREQAEKRLKELQE